MKTKMKKRKVSQANDDSQRSVCDGQSEIEYLPRPATRAARPMRILPRRRQDRRIF